MRHVAIKVMKPDKADAQTMQAFAAEANILHACHDAYIVGFIGAWATHHVVSSGFEASSSQRAYM